MCDLMKNHGDFISLDLPGARYTLGSPGASELNSVKEMNLSTALFGDLKWPTPQMLS